MSARGEGDGLAVVIEDVLNLNRIVGDVDDAIAPIHNLAFASEKDVVTRQEEDLLGLAGLAGKAIKLQVDGRRWRRRWRTGVDHLRRPVRSDDGRDEDLVSLKD